MTQPPALPQLFETLIGTPSVSSTQAELDQSNEPVIHQLAGWLGDLGCRIEILPVPGAPGKSNLIATLGQGDGGLILSGHTDTVPFDETRWNSNPFTLTAADDRWYGLGTCDMKGFFALVVEALKPLVGQRLKHPVIIVATADEETSMEGARALAQAGRLSGRYALIGEPTSLKPIHAHKGIMMERIRIQGQSGHSSNPALGNNAIDGMHAVMGAVMDYRSQLAQKYHNPLFGVPEPTINLGCIHGGDNPNRICGQCSMEFDVRLLPDMCSETLRQELHQRLQPIREAHNLQIDLEAICPSIEAFATPQQAELVQACQTLTGYSAQSVAFATEAPFFSSQGIETLVLGPGSIDQAHQPNEYIALDQLRPTVTLLRQLIRRLCCH